MSPVAAIQPHRYIQKMPKLESVKRINYDFAKYSAGDERKRLLAHGDKEIGAAAK